MSVFSGYNMVLPNDAGDAPMLTQNMLSVIIQYSSDGNYYVSSKNQKEYMTLIIIFG